jgi:hypothetical protein
MPGNARLLNAAAIYGREGDFRGLAKVSSLSVAACVAGAIASLATGASVAIGMRPSLALEHVC